MVPEPTASGLTLRGWKPWHLRCKMEEMVLRVLVDLSRTPAPPELIEMPDPTTKLDEILLRRINACGVYRSVQTEDPLPGRPGQGTRCE